MAAPTPRKRSMFHLFLNEPYGREHLLQSAYLAKSVDLPLTVCMPRTAQFLMYCNRTVITVRLDSTYLDNIATAESHVRSLLAPFDVKFKLFEPDTVAAGTLPEIPTAWSVMTCPRAVSALPQGLHQKHLGPNPRLLLKHVRFPIFVPCSVALSWRSVSVFVDSTPAGLAAAKIGVEIAHRAELPLAMFEVVADGTTREQNMVEDVLASMSTLKLARTRSSSSRLDTWDDALYEIPRDSLVVLGAERRKIWQRLRHARSKGLADLLPNPLLVTGYNCRPFFFTGR
jgi:hypothetical protein